MPTSRDTKILGAHAPMPLMHVASPPDFAQSLKPIGLLGRIELAKDHGKQLVAGAKAVKAAHTMAQTNIAITAIRLNEEKVIGTLLVTSMDELDALAETVDTQAAVFDRRSTQSAMVQKRLNEEARHDLRKHAQGQHAAGVLDADELAEDQAITAHLTRGDTSRALARAETSKQRRQSNVDELLTSLRRGRG